MPNQAFANCYPFVDGPGGLLIVNGANYDELAGLSVNGNTDPAPKMDMGSQFHQLILTQPMIDGMNNALPTGPVLIEFVLESKVTMLGGNNSATATIDAVCKTRLLDTNGAAIRRLSRRTYQRNVDSTNAGLDTNAATVPIEQGDVNVMVAGFILEVRMTCRAQIQPNGTAGGDQGQVNYLQILDPSVNGPQLVF